MPSTIDSIPGAGQEDTASSVTFRRHATVLLAQGRAKRSYSSNDGLLTHLISEQHALALRHKISDNSRSIDQAYDSEPPRRSQWMHLCIAAIRRSPRLHTHNRKQWSSTSRAVHVPYEDSSRNLERSCAVENDPNRASFTSNDEHYNITYSRALVMARIYFRTHKQIAGYRLQRSRTSA